MKRLIAFLAVFCLVLSFAACSTPQTPSNQGTTPNVGNPGDSDAYHFTYNGTDIAMHAEATDIIAALGEPKTYTEEASCAFTGLDKTYFYGSFYVQTYPVGDKDYIYSVWFADDTETIPIQQSKIFNV